MGRNVITTQNNGKKGFQKGQPRPANAGRKKGSLNKRTVSVKAAFEAAFQQIGGVDRLTSWAIKEPTEFFKLYAKLLPVQINGEMTINGTLAERLNRVKAKLGGATLLTARQEGRQDGAE